jgi:hypothetical protein
MLSEIHVLLSRIHVSILVKFMHFCSSKKKNNLFSLTVACFVVQNFLLNLLCASYMHVGNEVVFH